jgi:DNA modification methylase
MKDEVLKEEKMNYKIIHGNCTDELDKKKLKMISFFKKIDLTFLDPPFNQGKEYANHDDNLSDEIYWQWMRDICSKIYKLTSDGGVIYFMQREKNTEQVLKTLRGTGWTFQNLIIWKKKTSAVPVNGRFSKQYQIIAFAAKGEKPKVYNKLRIDLPVPPGYKYERNNGVFLTDVWDDIRELTSGYFAGDEAIRSMRGERVHTQQSPIALLLRIILASTLPGDTVLDPFTGTGTTLVVAHQLERNSIGIEIDGENIQIIMSRLKYLRSADNVLRYYKYYRYTPDLEKIWPGNKPIIAEQRRLL